MIWSSLKTICFRQLRQLIAPVKEIVPHLPPNGSILDVGCGYGWLTAWLAQQRPDCEFLGIDIDPDRIKSAQHPTTALSNLNFATADLRQDPLPINDYTAIICFDVLHHLPVSTQTQIVHSAFQLLQPQGKLIIKDIDTKPLLKYTWNYLHDKLVTKGDPVWFRSAEQWKQLLSQHGFTVTHLSKPSKGWLYPHLLLVATKP